MTICASLARQAGVSFQDESERFHLTPHQLHSRWFIMGCLRPTQVCGRWWFRLNRHRRCTKSHTVAGALWIGQRYCDAFTQSTCSAARDVARA